MPIAHFLLWYICTYLGSQQIGLGALMNNISTVYALLCTWLLRYFFMVSFGFSYQDRKKVETHKPQAPQFPRLAIFRVAASQ